MKRSATNMIIDVELYFESENNSLTSQEYENEASTISAIIHSLKASNVSFSSNDSNVMILVTMKSEGLSVECPQSSIPVFDDIIGCSKLNINACHICSVRFDLARLDHLSDMDHLSDVYTFKCTQSVHPLKRNT